MAKNIAVIVACTFLIEGLVLAQQARHPDLSGVWSYAIDRAPAALKKEVGGKVTIQKIDQSARHGAASTVRGRGIIATSRERRCGCVTMMRSLWQPR